MWRNLVHDILEEFASHATDRHAKRDFAYRLRTVQPEERDPWRHMRKLALKRRRLLRARVEVAQSRPPCPTCGEKVERLGTTGTPPKYCTRQCMQTAKRRRFEERHGKAIAKDEMRTHRNAKAGDASDVHRLSTPERTT